MPILGTVELESMLGGHELSSSISCYFVVSLVFIVYKGLAQLLAREQAIYPLVTKLSPQPLEGICRIDSRTMILSYWMKGVWVEGELYTYEVALYRYGTGLA